MKNQTRSHLSVYIIKILTIGLCLTITGVTTLNAQDIFYVNQAAGGADDGTSWTDAFNDLQPALDVATKGDQVWVAAGTYYPSKDKTGNDSPSDNRDKTFQMVDSVFLYGGFAGNESGPEERNIRANETTLSGDLGTTGDYTDDAYHVVTGTNNYLLDGFTLMNGNADGLDNDKDMGGGILNKEVSNVKILSCNFISNRGSQGGGIGNFYCTGSIMITGCRFFNNTALNALGDYGNGGAIANWNFAPVIRQCVFNENFAYMWGGAIYNWGSGSTTQLINCTLYENPTELDGGTMHNRDAVSSAVNCILWGNPEYEIANTSSGKCNVRYCVIDHDVYSAGTGSINSDPLVNVWGTSGYWMDPASPCVDAGDPASPDDPDGTRADIGIWSLGSDIDLAVMELVSPTSSDTAGEWDVEIILANLGIAAINSCEVNWDVNGMPQTPVSWNGNLGAGEISDPVVLGTYNFPKGFHTLKIWISNNLPGPDTDPGNDTLESVVEFINDLDIGLVSVIEPLSIFQYGTRDVRVLMKNYAQLKHVTSASIGFKIDDIPETPYSWTGDLAPGETDTVTLKQDHDFTEDTHTIQAWTYNPNGLADEDLTNDTLSVTAEGCSPLQGDTLYIQASGGDFTSFTEAVNYLASSDGIEGPMVFLVESNTYYEQVRIPYIPGASATNTITFRSASGDSSQVILTYAVSGGEDNYTLKLDSSRFFIFEDMTFEATGTEHAQLIEIANQSNNNTFKHNQFIGVFDKNYLVYSPYIKDGCNSANVFENNLFINAVEAIHMTGDYYNSIGLEIIGNTFTGQTGKAIYLEYYDNLVIESNKIFSANKITGIDIVGCREYLIVGNNQMRLDAGGKGIELAACEWGDARVPTLIYNNHIYLDNDPQHGICIYSNNDMGCKILFNTICLAGDKPESNCLYVSNTEYKYLRNNIMINMAGGVVYRFENMSGVNSDFNNLFANGDFLTRYNRILSDWQSDYNQDLHSFSIDPYFETEDGFRPQNLYLNGSGKPIDEVTVDIEGDARDPVHPDMGADEFTPCNTPLSGTFTVGGASPDYPTLNDAVKMLYCCGVNGPVTFNIAPDTINGQFPLQEIPGASETNTVTFQSVSGDSTDVMIHFTPVSSTRTYTIQLDGAEYITLKGLSVTSGEPWGHPVKLINGASHNQFLNNRFYSEDTMSNSIEALIYSKGSLVNNNLFAFNHFKNGVTGIFIDGTKSYGVGLADSVSGTLIMNNIFSGMITRGVYLKNHEDFEISANQFEILSNSANNGVEVWCSVRGLISNNFIRLETTGNGCGIYIHGSDYSVYHNTVKITGNSPLKSYAFYLSSGNNITLLNNVFANLAGGKAMRLDTLGLTSDYNLLYNWNLESWQDVYGRDLHSMVREPVFVSDTDLHTTDPWLNNRGTPLAEVTTDIDGEPRDAANPDVGADEFEGALFFSGEYTIGPSGDYASFTEAVDALSPVGVIGPVTFIVESGTYAEQFIIPEIPEVTESNNVTFRSASGDSTEVVVEFGSTASDNYIVRLDGARYITLEKMTFRALDTAYANVIEFTHGASANVIAHSILEGQEEKGQVFYSAGSQDNDNRIMNNLVLGGNVGVYMLGESESLLESGLEITGNRFIDQFSAAVYLKYQDTPMIINNRIVHDAPVEYEWAGIFLINCTGGFNDYGFTANNTVSLYAETKAAGIVLDAVSYHKILHNSVNIFGDADDSRVFNQQNTGNHLEVLNNIFSNQAEGLVIYTTEPGGYSSNHNDYYSNGDKFIYHNEYIPDLLTWQTNYAKDLNSYSVDPVFLSDVDLHTVHPLMNGTGTPVAEVFTDMDSEPRDPAAPDIGADEFIEAVYRIMEDTTICYSAQLEIDAGQGYDSYEWNSGETAHNIMVLNTTGIDQAWYRVTVVKGENTYKDSVLVTYTGPYVNLGPDSTYCIDGELVLDAGAGDFNYLWSDGSTDQTFTVPDNGQYSVIVSDALSGCEDSDTVTVSVYPMPHASIIREDTQLSLDETSFVAYQWYFNNEVMPGETNAMHYISMSGNYFVMFTDMNGCTNTSDTIRYWFTGMEAAENIGNIAVYPNPASDHVYLRITGETSPVRLYLVNSSGSMVQNVEIADPENQPLTRLDVSSLPEGLYFVIIQTDGESAVMKVVLE